MIILQHFLHKPVAFIILPIFALANTAIVFSGNISQTLTENSNIKNKRLNKNFFLASFFINIHFRK